MRTISAYLWIATVFSVTLPVRGVVSQNLIVGANVAIMELVIDIFMFWEETLLCLGPLVYAQKLDVFQAQHP